MTMLSQPPPDDQPTSSERSARPTLAIIGLGRVGMVLGRALHAAGYTIVAVSSRDDAKADATAALFGAQATSPTAAARAADLTLLTVSDDAIGVVAAELAAADAWQPGTFVVHASGASPARVLAAATTCGAQIGAFHPLGAFATPTAALPDGITFAIEATAPLHPLLWQMALDLGGRPFNLAPDDKTLYHAAAVIASNYTVTLAAVATELFERLGATPEQGLQALLPLMRTTLDNLEQQGLPDALTGPLVRGDVGTVWRHIQALDRTAPHIGLLYRALAQGTLPLAQRRGLAADAAGELQDTITLPSELTLERDSSS